MLETCVSALRIDTCWCIRMVTPRGSAGRKTCPWSCHWICAQHHRCLTLVFIWTPSPSGHLLLSSLLLTFWWDCGCLRNLTFLTPSPGLTVLTPCGTLKPHLKLAFFLSYKLRSEVLVSVVLMFPLNSLGFLSFTHFINFINNPWSIFLCLFLQRCSSIAPWHTFPLDYRTLSLIPNSA